MSEETNAYLRHGLRQLLMLALKQHRPNWIIAIAATHTTASIRHMKRPAAASLS
jgi:hypothetical protein